MHCRGQASTEALIVMGFALVLIFILIYAVLPVIVDFSQFSESAQAERALSKLISTVDAANAYGPGTSTTLYLYMPAGSLTYDNKIFTFTVQSSGTQVVKQAKANVEYENFAARNGVMAAGIKRVTVVSKDDLTGALVKVE